MNKAVLRVVLKYLPTRLIEVIPHESHGFRVNWRARGSWPKSGGTVCRRVPMAGMVTKLYVTKVINWIKKQIRICHCIHSYPNQRWTQQLSAYNPILLGNVTSDKSKWTQESECFEWVCSLVFWGVHDFAYSCLIYKYTRLILYGIWWEKMSPDMVYIKNLDL